MSYELESPAEGVLLKIVAPETAEVPADLDHILESRSLREMKQILDDNGMKYVELEFLTDWFFDGDRKKQSDVQRQKLLTVSNDDFVGNAFESQSTFLGVIFPDLNSNPFSP